MKPPTKFEKMRLNRERFFPLAVHHAIGNDFFASLPAASAKFEPARDEPTVPTMEVDGVNYREAPELDKTLPCNGCELKGNGWALCQSAIRKANAVFGGTCSDRKVIYLKAE